MVGFDLDSFVSAFVGAGDVGELGAVAVGDSVL